MTENEATNGILANTQAKTTKAKKAKAKPAVKPSNGQLTGRRLSVLKSITKACNLETAIKRTKLPERAVYHHLWHLRKDGFARSKTIEIEGKGEITFEQTARGAKVAKKS